MAARVVIGGVIQTNNSVQVSQVPLLGNIPYLGNLFKHTAVSTTNQEADFLYHSADHPDRANQLQ